MALIAVDPLRIIKTVLALTISIFAVVGIYVSYTIVERQKALRDVSRYDIVWTASQALTEFNRLKFDVAAFTMANTAVDKDEVRLRLDIMFNRLNILRSGDLRELAAKDREQKTTVDDLERVLGEIEPVIEKLDLPGAPQKILARLDTIQEKLTRFAAAANQYSSDQVAADQQRLLDLHRTFSILAAGLFVCGMAFIGLLFYQNRVVAIAHRKLRLATDDLRMAKEAAEGASDAKSRFLANMSHELRTPLNAIIGFSEIIAHEALGPAAQPKYREYAGDILSSGQHMYDLVNDILTMARLDAGHYEVTLEPIDLQHLADGALTMFKGTELASNRDVAIDPDGDWRPRLRADERAVRQILLNLLSNAVKFSAADTPVRLTCRYTAEGELHLTVSDRGIGMTPEEAERVGHPFYQADGRLARKYEGTGLGLSIVKGLIERHGGRLAIESQPGVGTRISVIFPNELLEEDDLAAVA
jgi:signal transduction histidine kinase